MVVEPSYNCRKEIQKTEIDKIPMEKEHKGTSTPPISEK